MVKVDINCALELTRRIERIKFFTKNEIEENISPLAEEIGHEITSRPHIDEQNLHTIKLSGIPNEACLCELIIKFTCYDLSPEWIKVDDINRKSIHAFVVCSNAPQVQRLIEIGKIKIAGNFVNVSRPLNVVSNYHQKKNFEHSFVKWVFDDRFAPFTIILTRTKNTENKIRAMPKINDYYRELLRGYKNSGMSHIDIDLAEQLNLMQSQEEDDYERRSPVRTPRRERSRSPIERLRLPSPDYQEPSISRRFPPHEPHGNYDEFQVRDTRSEILVYMNQLERQNIDNQQQIHGIKTTIDNYQREIYKLERIVNQNCEEIERLKMRLNFS